MEESWARSLGTRLRVCQDVNWPVAATGAREIVEGDPFHG
jgi:hypothetical protein